MRKMIAAIVLSVAASPAFAQHGRHHHHHGHHHGYGWVAPVVIGTAIGGVLIATQRGYIQPAPIYYPPVQYQQPQTMFRRVDVYIPECNCTRTIEVQIQ